MVNLVTLIKLVLFLFKSLQTYEADKNVTKKYFLSDNINIKGKSWKDKMTKKMLKRREGSEFLIFLQFSPGSFLLP